MLRPLTLLLLLLLMLRAEGTLNVVHVLVSTALSGLAQVGATQPVTVGVSAACYT